MMASGRIQDGKDLELFKRHSTESFYINFILNFIYLFRERASHMGVGTGMEVLGSVVIRVHDVKFSKNQ